MQQTIIITGGAGFVGANLTQYALKKGYRVIVIDTTDRLHRLEAMKFNSDSRLLFYPLNLIEDHFSLPDEDVRVLIHLAALPQVDYSLYYPERVISNNVVTLLKSIHFALERRIPLLFTSSVEVYGGNEGDLFEEVDAYNPLSPYAASKVGCEAVIRSYVAAFGLISSTARLTNLYGAWQAPDRILPRLITQILSGYPCEVDRGRDRDFLYIEDAVEALLGMVEQSLWGETFNLSSGYGYDNFKLISLLKEISGKTIDVSFIDMKQRDGRGKSLVSSSQKLQTMLAWKPSTVLRDGIKLSYEWYTANSHWWEQFDENIRSNRMGPNFLIDYTYDLQRENMICSK